MTDTDLATDVQAHLAESFFPPLSPDQWLEPALAAIEAVEAGDPGRGINVTHGATTALRTTPRGVVEDDDGRVVADAVVIMRVLRLDEFARVPVED